MRARLLLMALCSAGVAMPAQAQDAGGVAFDAAPGVPVRARVRDGGGVDVRIGKDAVLQQLDGVADEEGRSRLDHEDVDFDGLQDLVVRASVGQVNEAVAVYRYDARTARLQPLAAPSGTPANCDGLWSLRVDAPTRTLVSTCRGGPMWYTDFYRYQGEKLYLYRAEQLLMLDTQALAAVLAVDKAGADAGPLAVWTTYDAAGRALEHAIGDGLAPPASGVPLRGVNARVVPARLALYRAVGDADTRRYLIAGDRAELLDARDGWLQVRYRNPTRGPVIGWVQVALPEQG
jgi:hypothetical protein